jgi:dihydroorotate dehydrogenase electron transfer subunit
VSTHGDNGIAQWSRADRTGSGERGGSRLLGRVRSSEVLGTMVRLTVDVPGWRGALPGQFVLLRAEPSRCFLARAISVSDEVGERVSFLIAPVNEGTQELCGLTAGRSVWVLGPLGKGFDLDALVMSPGRAVVVAGGVGVAPFPLLLSRMVERYRALFPDPAGWQAGSPSAAGPEVLILLGFRNGVQSEGSAPIREAASRMGESGLRCRLEVATEDGSRGPAERVTDLLARHLQSGDKVAVCGPPAMSQGVWGICSVVPDVETWFSLETNMACGVGSCHGCLITMADGSGGRVCRDGPVFKGEDVFGG